MSDSIRVYWGGYTEEKLAQFQKLQVGNYCAKVAIAAGFDLLGHPLTISGNELGHKTLSMGFGYQIFNGGTLPFQQVHLINQIARITGQRPLPIRASLAGTQNIFKAARFLSDSRTVMLVTLYWARWQGAPNIVNAAQIRADNSKPANGHTMVFAACDQDKTDLAGNLTPFGFINSWEDNTSDHPLATLSWMSSSELLRYWKAIVYMRLDSKR